RPRPRERLEEPPERPERLFAPRRLACPAGHAEHALDDQVSVAPTGERLAERDLAARLAHHLDERPERDAVAVGQARAAERRRAFAEPVEELLHETRLADPGRAEDRDEPRGLLGGDPLELRAERLELLVAADERRAFPGRGSRSRCGEGIEP